MNYNLFIQFDAGGFNILNLQPEKLQIVIDAYKLGRNRFTINGTEYNWGEVKVVKIYSNESSYTEDGVKTYCQQHRGWIKVFGAGHLVSQEVLSRLGNEVTGEFLQDIPFGGMNDTQKNEEFVNPIRIEALKRSKFERFDVTKLVAICEEINSNWAYGNYYTVGLLLRTAINHVPPIFDDSFKAFASVVANYKGSKSFKSNMEHLDKSLRSIADMYTHELISKRELIPTKQQVDFRANFDLLLTEVGEILK